MVNSTTIQWHLLSDSDAEFGKIPLSHDHNYASDNQFSVGRHFADASLWVAIVHLLAMFKFVKPVDENGVEVEPNPEWSTGVVS